MSGALYKRGQVYWLRTDPVTGERRSTKCTNKKAAEAFLAERERLAADPHYEASHTATIAKWSDELNRVKRATKAEGTANMYAIKIGHVVRLFGAETKMVEITPTSVDRYVAQRLEEGAKPNTIGKELTSLVQMCKLAKRGGAYAGDISSLRPVGFSIEYTPRTGTISRENATKVFAKLADPKKAAIAIALATGARHSEIARITPEDVDLVNWTVHIPGTKTKKSDRIIPITLAAHRFLLEAAVRLGLPARWPRMSKDLPALCEKLGIPRVTANDLRRSFATWNIEAGISREDVAKLLGHGSTTMVFKVYGRESAEAFGKKLERNVGTESSQSPRDGSVCVGGTANGFSCFLAVAPPGIEPGRPDGSEDFKSTTPIPGRAELATFPSDSRSRVQPDDAGYNGVRTDPSQRRRLTQLAAVGFRAASRSWFARDRRDTERALKAAARSLPQGAGR